MSELIDRDAVMLRVREFIGNPTYNENMLVNDLNALPSAEPERKKGRWLWDEEDRCYCSECGNEDDLSIDGVYMMHDFCPNCGAEMSGGE